MVAFALSHQVTGAGPLLGKKEKPAASDPPAPLPIAALSDNDNHASHHPTTTARYVLLPSPVLTEPTASCGFGNRAGRCDSPGDGAESEMGCCTGSKGKASIGIGAGPGAGKDGGGGQLSHGPVRGGWRCGRVARGWGGYAPGERGGPASMQPG
jgi:hypothetical protein